MPDKPPLTACVVLAAAVMLASGCSSLSSSGIGTAKTGRLELSDDFKNGDARLACRWHCALTWGLERQHAKALYDAGAWNELAFDVLKIGYADDLSYYYLARAAEGLGYSRAAENYYRLSRGATLKCAEMYGDCYGFVFPRDARPGAPTVVKKEAKQQYAAAPRPKEAPRPAPRVTYERSAPAATSPAPEPPSPPSVAETAVPREAVDAAETSPSNYPASVPAAVDSHRPANLSSTGSPSVEKRPLPSVPKKSAPQKPVQQAIVNKPRDTEAKTEPAAAPAAEKRAPEAPSTPAPSVTFEEISEKFGTHSRLTEAQKREEWKKYEGRCVQWSGELSYVGGFLRGTTLGFKHYPRTLTYDVLVSAPDGAREAAQMKKGGHYTYRGTLKKFGGPILPISLDWGCRGQQRVTDQAKAG
jgi:hypothetical protein